MIQLKAQFNGKNYILKRNGLSNSGLKDNTEYSLQEIDSKSTMVIYRMGNDS
jgi:hypothetical protein